MCPTEDFWALRAGCVEMVDTGREGTVAAAAAVAPVIHGFCLPPTKSWRVEFAWAT